MKAVEKKGEGEEMLGRRQREEGRKEKMVKEDNVMGK